jgi:hypothetical protein
MSCTYCKGDKCFVYNELSVTFDSYKYAYLNTNLHDSTSRLSCYNNDMRTGRVIVRIDILNEPELHDAVKAIAKHERRSMSQQLTLFIVEGVERWRREHEGKDV